jgi:hypothetical protein
VLGTPAKESRDRLDNGLLIDVRGIPNEIVYGLDCPQDTDTLISEVDVGIVYGLH